MFSIGGLMDIITQRFIAIGNRIIRELRRLSDVIQQQIDAARKRDQGREQKDSPAPEVRAVLNAPQGIETRKGAADAKQERNYQRHILRVQWILCFATIGAFGAAVYYAHYAEKQWRTMDDTYTEIQKQTNATKQAAGAATESAATASSALDASGKQFRIDERPYLVLISMKLREKPDTPGHRITADVCWKNTGKTPALNGSEYAWVDIYPTEPTHPEDWVRKASASTSSHLSIGAGDQKCASNDDWTPLMQDDAAKFAKGYHIYFVGAFVYYDVFKERHYTTGCGFYEPSSSNAPLALFVCNNPKTSEIN
jgi:hypothetical protein